MIPACSDCGRSVVQVVLDLVVPSAPTRWTCGPGDADGCALLQREDAEPVSAHGPLLARFVGLPDSPWMGNGRRLYRDARRRA